MMRKLGLCLAAATLGGAALAADVFADATEYFVNPDPDIGSIDYDGTSPTNIPGTLHGPMLRIQDAVDLADGNGTIITLAPGVYDQGGKLYGKDVITNRVLISKENVKLRGLPGHRDDTIILGRHDYESDPEKGLGPAAVRCVYGQGETKANILESLTITGGATLIAKDGNNSERGGGARAVTLVDCVVSNNAACRGGGLYDCTAFRCRIINNCSGTAGGAAGCYARLSNCLVSRNWGGSILYYYSATINCTIADNQQGKALFITADASSAVAQHVYNTLVINNSNLGNSGMSVYSCVARNGDYKSADENSVTNNISEYGELVCPGMGDVRILTTSHSYNRGKGEYVNDADILPFPEGYEPRDIDGNLIPTSGAIHAGCSQTAVAPAGAALVFRQNCDVVGYGSFGDLTRGYSGGYPYLRPTVTGEVFRVRPVLSEGTRCYALYENELGSSASSVYALYNGDYCFPPRPIDADDTPVTIRPVYVQNVYYVDGTNGSDDYDGTSPTKPETGTVGPKKTIMAAVALHKDDADHTLVYVAPGTYEGASGIGQAVVAVTNKNLGLISTVKGGATIRGRKDPATETGLGENALRCVSLRSYECFIQGFVLTDGYGSSETSTGSEHAGGGVWCVNQRAAVMDCVITNCSATTGAAQLFGRALRTAYYNNTATSGSIMWVVNCYSCVFAGNTFTEAVFCDRTDAYFCSVAAGNQRLIAKNAGNFVGVVAEDVSERGTPEGVTVGVNVDGCFADPAAHDFRLGCLSPAYGAVPVTDIWDLDNYLLVSTDFNGDDLQLADGRFTAGAVHNRTPLPCVVVSAAGSSGTTVTGGRVGTNVVTRADQTFTVTADSTRPYCGIRKDGEIVSTANTYEIAAAGVTSNAAYDVVYGTDWYVDQKNGIDANGGGTLALAKKHLTAAATLAVSGDTVRVAPGTYGDEDGTMHHTALISKAPFEMPSRVWVKEGVTIESLEGPEKTIILGKQTAGEGNYGLGDDSIRCVVLSKNAKIKGFTLTGGRTRICDDPDKKSYADDFTGGAVLGSGPHTSTVEDCIVTNNCAGYCGAGYQSRFVRSILVGNTATNRCGCVRTGRFVGCLIDRNRGSNTIEHFYEFDSCTIGRNNVGFSGGNPTILNYPYCVVKNSVIMKTGVYAGPTGPTYTAAASNTVFVTGAIDPEKWALDYKSQIVDNDTIASWFDGDLRPILKDGSPVLDKVDAESAALSDAEAVGTYDASGMQRVMNGYRDIGALEADWRGNYAAAITRSPRFAVTNATPEVRRDSPAAGDVKITDGAALAATWKSSAAGDKYRVIVQVSGSGTLTVTQNDAVVGTATAAEGEKTLTLAAGALTDALKFSYAGDDGYGVVRRLAGARGMSLVIR